MKNLKVYCFFACLLLFTNAAMYAQPFVHNRYGDDKDQGANAITLLPNGNARIGGFTCSSTQAASPCSGLLLEVSGTQPGTLTMAKKYIQSSESFTITSMDAHPTNGKMAAVANARPGIQTHTDAVFMDIGATGNVLFSRTWNSTGNEFARCVKVLADGSFVIVGRIVNTSNVAQSFITRLSAAPNYNVIFHRVFGNPTGVSSNVDEAIAVDQLGNGSILVGGTTRHFARTAQGAIFLIELALDGSLLQYHTYQLDATVFDPLAKDMAILSDGSVVVVGTTLDPLGNGTNNGLVLRTSPNLLSAVAFEVSQPGAMGLDDVLRAVIANPVTGGFSAVGGAERNVLGTKTMDGLAMTFTANGNIEFASFIRGGLRGTEEMFTDCELRNNATILHAVGTTTSHDNSALIGVNVLSSQMSLSGGPCFSTSASFQFVPKLVTYISPNPQFTTTMAMITGTLNASTPSVLQEQICLVAKTDYAMPGEAEAATTPLTTELFPNPASGTVTLRIAELEGSARIQIADLSGRIVQQMEIQQAETQLELAAMAPGLYVVNIFTNKARVSKKLIVQ